MSANMFVLLLFLQITFILWVSMVVFRKSLLDPVVLFNLPWILPLSVALMGIFEYQSYLIFRSYLIVTLTVLAFTLGCYSAFFAANKGGSKKHNFLTIPFLWNSKTWQVFIFGLVLIYGASVFVSISEKIPITTLLNFDLTELRRVHWENINNGFQNLFEGLKTLTRPFVILNAIALAFYSTIKNKNLFVLSSILSFIFLTIESFQQGGRILIAFTGLNFLYAFLFFKFSGRIIIRKSNVSRIFVSSVGLASASLALVYFFLVWFPAARNPYLTTNFGYYLGLSNPVRLSTQGEKLVEVFGPQVYSALFGLSYFTNPLATLTLYYKYSDFTSWYYWGEYTFPFFSKFIDLLRGTPYNWLEIRERLSAIPGGLGYSTNPWSTGIRDLLIDFGEPGTILFMFGFGWVAQVIYKKAQSYPSDIYILLMSLVSSVMLVFSFFGYIHNGYFFYPFLIVVTVIILVYNKNFFTRG